VSSSVFRRPQTLPTFQATLPALAVLALVWLLFMIRLYELQVRDRGLYEVKSEDNRIVRLTRLASRGEILDRKGELLVASRFAVDLVAPNRHLKPRDLEDVCLRLSPALGVPPKRLRAAYHAELRKTYAYQAVPIQQNLTETQTVRAGEILWRVPEARLQKRLTRWYAERDLEAHALGYVNEVSKEDMERDATYPLGSVIGRAGIEEILEPYLRGADGWKWAEVDAHGRIRRDLMDLPQTDPVPGATAHLTLDRRMARAFEEEFGDSSGFGILMDAQTGAIRAIFSKPAFDPNRLVTTDIQYIRHLRLDANHPFFNRAVQSAFPPGSTFKTVNFVAAVESGLADEGTRFYCSGKFRMGRRIAECWKEKGHGRMSLVPALIHSCNVYFYNLGLVLRVDRMHEAGRMFRLGEKTGFILSGEPSGILPNAEWKERRMGEKWTGGDDVNMSIGQGFLLVTPLQQVVLMASLFNGGAIVRPYLIEKAVSPSGDIVYAEGMNVRSYIPVSDSTLALVRTALRGVVVQGTGTRAGRDAFGRPHGVAVYGKTGTVQRAGREAVERAGVDPEDHGWFLCYFELGDEKFTAVVMKEAAGHGGAVAAPVIGRFISRLLQSPI